MSKKKSWIISIVVFLAFLTHGSLGYSASNELITISLKGLTAITVIVEKLQPNMKGMGLTEEQIQTDIELKLRMAGIKVVSLSEMFKIPGMPYLYFNLNSTRGSQGTFVFNISLSLRQRVYLERNAAINFDTDTWSSARITGYDRAEPQMINFIRGGIKDMVDEFINDYLSVNPKGGN